MTQQDAREWAIEYQRALEKAVDSTQNRAGVFEDGYLFGHVSGYVKRGLEDEQRIAALVAALAECDREMASQDEREGWSFWERIVVLTKFVSAVRVAIAGQTENAE